jgi:hypothetical protein
MLRCAASALLLLAGACARPPAPDRPDVVLVSLDTVRADHLSLHGYGRATSPALDRFAGANCLVFDGSIAASTWTLPTHATMFTGLLPGEHGLTSLKRNLAPEIPTLAELLAESGYATSAITDGGFLAPSWGLERGFAAYSATSGQAWEPKDARPLFATATAELDRLRRGATPFFLFVHTLEAHQPHANREGFADAFLDGAYFGPFEDEASVSSRFAGTLPAPEAERLVALYDGEIRRLDHYLGRFLERVWSRRAERQVVVLITSDHGEAFGEHGSYGHGLGRVELENVTVPLLVCDARGSAPRRLAVPSSTLDVLPTLLEATATPARQQLLGRSLLSLDAGEKRWRVAHGFNALPVLDEEWLRVEGPDGTTIIDVRRARASLAGTDESRARSLAVLARGRGADRLVLLPRGRAEIGWPADAEWSVVAALDDVSWRFTAPPAGVYTMPLDERGRSLLLVRGTGVAGARSPRLDPSGAGLRFEAAGVGPATMFLRNPLGGEGLAPLVLFGGGRRATAGAARIDAERLRELAALGYL